MTDSARAAESFGVQISNPMGEAGLVRGAYQISRYDRDATDWVSAKLGGERAGHAGFVQPSDADFARYNVNPYDVSEPIANLLTQAGWGRVLLLTVASGATQAFDATHCRIGVGTATAAATTGQTDLQAPSGATGSRFWQLVTGIGTTGTGTGTARLTLVATVGTADANFAWQEFAVDQGGTATATGTTSGPVVAPLLSRAVSSQGTKASGQTWTATYTLDVT